MTVFIGEVVDSGVLLATDGVLPPQVDDALVRRSRSDVAITDGPFAEAKEVIAGFAIVSVEPKEEAVARPASSSNARPP